MSYFIKLNIIISKKSLVVTQNNVNSLQIFIIFTFKINLFCNQNKIFLIQII